MLLLMDGVLAEVLPRWGKVVIAEAAPGGVVNTVVFATLDGEAVVVRASKRPNAALRWELDLMNDARRAGLAVPDVIPTTDGDDEAEGVVIFRRLRGRHPDGDDWLAVRDYLCQLHALERRSQRPGFRSSRDLIYETVGGDIDLSHLPTEAISQCRAAWERLADIPQTTIHGDPGENNIFITDEGPTLIDWDEARIDAPHFDLAALPDHACPLDGDERWVARQAASAWEAAISWRNDPEYARWRLSQLERDPS